MSPLARVVLVAAVAAAAGLLAGVWHGRGALRGSGAGEGATQAGDPSTARATVRPARPGDPLPPLRLPDLDGKVVELAAIAPGRPLLVNVWASWCGPCVEEMPELQRLARTQGDTGVQVVGLALDTPEAVRDFLARIPVGYPILLDTPGPADASVHLGDTDGLLPYSVLVDADRRVVRQKLGPFAPGEIEEWVRH